MGQSKDWPGGFSGIPTPIQFTTLECRNSGGDNTKKPSEVTMTLQLSAIAPKVAINNGKAVTTSQDVADYFGKLHKDVLKKINSLDCSPKFTSANFRADVQKVDIGNGATRDSKFYEMTKDGFVFLVMGFTGKKAAAFKEAYIAEFNRMEAELHKPVDYLSHPANPVRILWTYLPNGEPVSHLLRDDEYVATQSVFIELARRAGWICMPKDELLQKFGIAE